MSYGATRAGAILAGGFQKVFENLPLVDIFRICSNTKHQGFSAGSSVVFYVFGRHFSYIFDVVLTFFCSSLNQLVVVLAI